MKNRNEPKCIAEHGHLRPFEKHGTCELCGRHNAELHVLILPDWIGLACAECHDQMQMCYMRQIQAAAGHSEPAE